MGKCLMEDLAMAGIAGTINQYIYAPGAHFYLHKLTLIAAWISNVISVGWITYQFPT